MSDPDREAVRAYYDAYGDQEWARLEIDAPGRVSWEIHRRFLARFVVPGMVVLEAGAGPGRFTLELAALGAQVDVTDVSAVQLDLHRQRLAGSPAEDHVRSRSLLDICDTARIPDGAYDAVLAFGGPLSYAFEKAPDALRGLMRVTRPGGVVVASVMSLLGSWRHFLPGVLADVERCGDEAFLEVMRTGDIRPLGGAHICRLFRSREVADMVAHCGGELVAMSASNWASLGDADALAGFESQPRRWAMFLDEEEAACAEPGALDGGTHVLFAARRPVSG